MDWNAMCVWMGRNWTNILDESGTDVAMYRRKVTSEENSRYHQVPG